MFKEIEYSRRERKPEILFSLSNIVRFRNSLVKKYKFENKKSVRIFIDEENDFFKVGFMFLDDKSENGLKLSSARSGSFVSGNSVFNVLGFRPKEMKKRNFTPKLEKLENKDILVIEVPKLK